MSQSLPQLSDKLLASWPEAVRRPAYDRSAVTLGIVHLGIGAFHRAHQAVYTDDRLASDELDWGISGMSLRSPAVREALQPQDGLYTVLERGPEGDRARGIGPVPEGPTVPDDPRAALGRPSRPNLRI